MGDVSGQYEMEWWLQKAETYKVVIVMMVAY
jgi:hypothetical protein